VLVVAAYGIILPQAVLDLPRHGCLNIHASLLPRWRGAAPIHRAIQAGDAETGITIMQMDAGLDTGPMLLKRAEADPRRRHHRQPPRPPRLAGRRDDRRGPRSPAGGLAATPQPADGVTYAAKIGKAEAIVDWTRPAAEIERAIRAFNPFPGAIATHARRRSSCGGPGHRRQRHAGRGTAGRRRRCDRGLRRRRLCITELQKPGAKRLSAADFLRGMPIAAGSRFA
jgi:methionyl-tRNA formyltransferase